MKANGVAYLSTSGALAKIQAALEDKAPGARQGALSAITALCGVGASVEPYLVPLLPAVLNALADKVAPVRAAAVEAAEAVQGLLCPHSVAVVLPMLFEAMKAQKWQTNEGGCKILGALAENAPQQVGGGHDMLRLCVLCVVASAAVHIHGGCVCMHA